MPANTIRKNISQASVSKPQIRIPQLTGMTPCCKPSRATKKPNNALRSLENDKNAFSSTGPAFVWPASRKPGVCNTGRQTPATGRKENLISKDPDHAGLQTGHH